MKNKALCVISNKKRVGWEGQSVPDMTKQGYFCQQFIALTEKGSWISWRNFLKILYLTNIFTLYFRKVPDKNMTYMMTSSNGNIFRVTGHLCGEFTGPHECLLSSVPESWGWWFEMPSCPLWRYRNCPACRTYLIATRFWVVVICPIIKCLTVLEFSFILFDLCLFITILNFILNYVPIVTFWIFTYHKIWILLIIFCFIWNYWIIYFLTCLEVFWSVVS